MIEIILALAAIAMLAAVRRRRGPAKPGRGLRNSGWEQAEQERHPRMPGRSREERR